LGACPFAERLAVVADDADATVDPGGVTFGVIVLGRTCLYGTATDNITLNAAVDAGGTVTTVQPVGGANTFTLLEGQTSGIPCPGTGTLAAIGEDGGLAGAAARSQSGSG
jgi:hypothetical protein